MKDVTIDGSANVTATGYDLVIDSPFGRTMINTSGTVTATTTIANNPALSGGDITITSGTVTSGNVSANLVVNGTAANVSINGNITSGGNLTVSDGTVKITGTVTGNQNLTGGTVWVGGVQVYPAATPSTYTISGKITDKETGSPVADAAMYLKNAGGTEIARTTTDTTGAYSFSNLPVGVYNVEASAIGYLTFTLVEWELTSAISSGTGWDMVLNKPGDTPTFASIIGTIKGSDTNSGINGAAVQLKSTSGGLLATSMTDPSGQYRFDSLAVGTYSIESSASGYNKGTLSNIELQTANITGKDLTLTKSGGGDNGGGNGGGSGSGGGSTTPTTPTTPTAPEQQPNQPVAATAPVTATAGANGTANVAVSDKSITDAIAKAQADARAQGSVANGISVGLNVTMPQGATSLTASLSPASLNSLVSAGVSQLEISGSPVSLGLDLNALKEIQKQSNGNISISFTPATGLSEAVRALLGNRPVYNITISYTDKNGKPQNVSSLGNGTATLSIPYAPGRNEAVGYLFGVYVDGAGNATRIPGSAYDPNSGSILLGTNHFSVYGVGYETPSAKFTDIATHWGKDSIDYVVGRGLLSGTSKTTFAPNTAMTRGMLVTALGRLAGVDVKAYTTNSFTDVKADSTFRPYIEWARSKGIIQGIGNGQFAPDRAVTREEIAVIFANFAKATGYKLPVTRTATTYADASSIGSAYKTAVTTMQQAGIMMGGTGNKFNPKSSATRAEVSSVLHRYIKLTIDPATAQGWALNDAGQYLYYKDGKILTGWQTIDGVKYFFYSTGALQTDWVKDDAGNWYFYSGNIRLTGFWNIGSGDAQKTYYFTKDGMVAGKWLELDGKWYYFNADGSLAKSTKVDGYEIDKDGVRKTQ